MVSGNRFGPAGRLLTVALVAATVVACNDTKADQDTAKANPDQPAAQVDLPSAPPASAFEIPETNDDGTLRVEGLIHFNKKHLGNQVRVKGYIAQINGNCDPAKAKKNDETCLKPHFIIKDEQGAKQQLTVVGFERDFFDKADAEVGQTRVFQGSYKKMAQQFVNSGDGLILLDKVDEVSVLEED